MENDELYALNNCPPPERDWDEDAGTEESEIVGLLGLLTTFALDEDAFEALLDRLDEAEAKVLAIAVNRYATAQSYAGFQEGALINALQAQQVSWSFVEGCTAKQIASYLRFVAASEQTGTEVRQVLKREALSIEGGAWKPKQSSPVVGTNVQRVIDGMVAIAEQALKEGEKG